MKRINNYYYLVAGILTVLFSLTHALNAEKTVIPVIERTGIDMQIRTAIFYVWHIITAENLVFGLALLLMAFYKEPTKISFVVWLIIVVLISRLLVLVGSVIFYSDAGVGSISIDLLAITVYVGILLLGVRKHSRQ